MRGLSSKFGQIRPQIAELAALIDKRLSIVTPFCMEAFMYKEIKCVYIMLVT